MTSLGRVLLAALPEDEARRRIAASPRPALTPHTETDVDALMARVREARSQGWCLLNQELEEGLVSIAAPVTDRAGRTVAAINVSGQINRTGVETLQQEILPRLRATADAISRRLQARGS